MLVKRECDYYVMKNLSGKKGSSYSTCLRVIVVYICLWYTYFSYVQVKFHIFFFSLGK